MTTSGNHTHLQSDGVIVHGHAQAGNKLNLPKPARHCRDIVGTLHATYLQCNISTMFFHDRNNPKTHKPVRNYIITLTAFLLFATAGTEQVSAQGLGLNNPTPDPSAILDLTATDRGLLVPRMTSTDRINITSPATGLLVYDTDLGAFYFYDGTVWKNLSLDTDWTVSGNYVYNTTDSIGVGTVTPITDFHIAGFATIGNAIVPGATEGENILNIISGSNASGQTNGIAFMENTSGFGMKLGYDGTLSGADNVLGIYDNTDTRVITFENGGNVGLGVLNPTNKLEVAGTAEMTGFQLTTSPTAGYILTSDASGVGTWQTPADDGDWTVSDNYVYNTADSIGIGTATPSEKLELFNGNILLDGTGSSTTGTINFINPGSTTGEMSITSPGGDPGIVFKSNTSLLRADMARSSTGLGFGASTTTASPGIGHLFIENGGNVGIGTTSPDQRLHVHKGSAGAVTAHTNSALVVENNGNAFLNFLTPNTGVAGIYFGDPENNTIGEISYFHTDNSMRFWTNGGTEKMMIDNAGDVGIGTTNPGAKLEVVEATTNSAAIRASDGSSRLDVIANLGAAGYNPLSQAGDIGLIFTDGTQNTGNLVIAPWSSSAAGIRITNTGDVGIGTSSPGNKLHIYQSTGQPRLLIESDGAGASDAPDIILDAAGTDRGTSTTEFHEAGVFKASTGWSTVATQQYWFVYEGGTTSMVSKGGNIGIGTTNPGYKLDVTGVIRGSGEIISTSANAFRMVQGNYGVFWRNDGSDTYLLLTNSLDQYGSWNSFRPLRINNASGNVYIDSGTLFANVTTDRIGIGTTGPASKLHVVAAAYLGNGGIRLEAPNGNRWNINTFSSTDNDLGFFYNGSTRGWLDDVTNVGSIDFTAQHRSLPSVGSAPDYKEKIGYIVVADGNITNLNGEELPTISESLPRVQISEEPYDRRVYGVIAGIESPENERDAKMREYQLGIFVTAVERANENDYRLIINSGGEGAIWVSNYAGNMRNGDYVVTSPVPGIGMKQDDDVQHNYTVAKVIMDCDFDLNSDKYECKEIKHKGKTYKMAFLACVYLCN